MYEAQTFAEIMQRMLNRVAADIDKREGSIVFDALAPAALELAELYAELDRSRTLSFADTASGEYLDRRTEEFGIVRDPATYAKRKGLFYANANVPVDVPIGSRFTIANINYIVTERLALGEFYLQSETLGRVGNQNFGSMLPIDYIDKLVSAELTDIIIPGEDAESDDIFRDRFLDKVRRPGTSGNIADYLQWTKEVPGIGAVQVQPIWNGPGTVRLFVINSEKRVPSAELVNEVQNYIVPNLGLGEGKAPIGAHVTVSPATEVPIDISVQLSLISGVTIEDVRVELLEGISNYFKLIAFNEPLLRTTRISAILLDNPHIVDFSDLTLNGGLSNIEMQLGQVAVLGTVSLDE